MPQPDSLFLYEELIKIYNLLNENVSHLNKIIKKVEKEKDFQYPLNPKEELMMSTIDMWYHLWKNSITDNKLVIAKEQLKNMISYLYRKDNNE